MKCHQLHSIKVLPDIINDLTYIFNLPLCQGKFITAFRHAKVVSIHKKGDVQNLNNYGLLSSFSKSLEKIVYRSIHSLTALTCFQILSVGSGEDSTSHANCLLADKIAAAFEKSFVLSEFFLTSRKPLILLTIKLFCINLVIMALKAQF